MKSDEIRTVSAIGSQNENLTRSLGIDVNSLVIPPTVNEYSDFENNSLEMKSQLTRDTTRSLQSRQIDNQQLADLGSFNDYLAHRRRVVIDRLMALLEEWLENNPAFTRHTQGGSASPSRSVTSGQGSSYSTGSHNTRGPTRSKRSLQSDGSDGSEDNGDENGEGKRNNKRSRVSPPNTRKLACPFFKNDSSKHEHKQACTGPGWGNISRVKHVSPVLPGLEVSSLTSVREHIYRCHWQPHKCHRCYDAFESAEAFEAHQRQDEPCRKRSPKHDDGISQAQYFHLKKKPQSTAKTDRERWEEVYRIIFPEAQEMPSPCEIPYPPKVKRCQTRLTCGQITSTRADTHRTAMMRHWISASMFARSCRSASAANLRTGATSSTMASGLCSSTSSKPSSATW